MNFIPTKLEGCFVIEPKVIQDERGYFMEVLMKKLFKKE
jgi:dTDP-4-dehydrorhamnose 3,5-epimerase